MDLRRSCWTSDQNPSSTSNSAEPVHVQISGKIRLQNQLGAQMNTPSSLYLLVELHKRPSQLVCFPCACPRCLAAQAMLENGLQVGWVDGLQLLPIWVAEGKEEQKQMRFRVRVRESERWGMMLGKLHLKGMCARLCVTWCLNYICTILLYSADPNNRWEAGCERMAPYSTPCWHGGNHLNVLQTNPLQVFIVEPFVCQSLEETQREKDTGGIEGSRSKIKELTEQGRVGAFDGRCFIQSCHSFINVVAYASFRVCFLATCCRKAVRLLVPHLSGLGRLMSFR